MDIAKLVFEHEKKTGGDVSEEALDQQALQIAQYKQAPPSTRSRSTPAGARLMAKIAALNPDYDETEWNRRNAGGVAAARVEATAIPAADKASLTKLVQQRDAIQQYERTVIANLDYLVELGKKVDATGSPVINRWINAGRQNIAGDTDVTAFNTQLRTTVPEVGRIQFNPNLTGVLTEGARKEVEGVIPEGVTLPQLQTIRDVLRRDFGKRQSALDTTIDEVAARTRAGTVTSPATSPATTAPVTATDSTAAETPVGDTKTGRGGVVYRKVKPGPDVGDPSRWERVDGGP
jgi:hypothetical protein